MSEKTFDAKNLAERLMNPTSDRSLPSPDQWDRIETTIIAFETAWAHGERPSIASYLPIDVADRQVLLIELIHAEFEFRLKAGETARVESYLDAWPELVHRPDFASDLIRAEWTIRVRRERDLSIDQFLARFPQQRAELAATLARAQPIKSDPLPAHFEPSNFVDGPLPKQVGKYELRQKVGEGGFGLVYRAWDFVLMHEVAIKIPRPEVAATPIDVLNFLREARNAIRLRHPNIVGIQDAGPIDGTICLVSEFIEGITLADRLRIGPLEVFESVQMMVPVLEALHHAHRRKIIHRDLKPSNILLDNDGNPHLTDFGLAKRTSGDSTLSPLGAMRVMIGTPAYMAPEQARGESTSVDARSDVYTAGVVLYEMLTGSVPFRGLGRLLQLQIEEAAPTPLRELNDEIPLDLETICLKALAKDPAGRYQSARAMANDLINFIAGKPVSTRPAGLVELDPLPHRSRSRSWVERAVLGLIIVVILGTGSARWIALERREVANQPLIEQLVRDSTELTHLPLLGGASSVEEHRRFTEAIWTRLESWTWQIADRPDLTNLRVDLLVRLARHWEAVGSDATTRVAWERAVNELRALTRPNPADWQPRVELAQGLTALGQLRVVAGLTSEAQPLFRQAASTWKEVITIQRRQLGENPNHDSIRFSLAEAILAADQVSRWAELGQFDISEVEKTADPKRGRGPLSRKTQEALASIQGGLARHSQTLDQPRETLDWALKSVWSAEAARREGGMRPELARIAAQAAILSGHLQTRSEVDLGLAVPNGASWMFNWAITHLTETPGIDLLDLNIQRLLAEAEAGLGTIFAQQKRPLQATRWLRQALDRNQVISRACPAAHADLARSSVIRVELARLDTDQKENWSAIVHLSAALLCDQRAVWLAPGISAYRQALNDHASLLLRLISVCCNPKLGPSSGDQSAAGVARTESSVH